jgi:hypothetical protein
VRIAILVEGDTEKAFLPSLQAFLSRHLAGRMPRLSVRPYDGRIPKGDKLRRIVEDLLTKRPPAVCIKEIFERGRCRDSYIKPRDALRILRDNDLSHAIDACPELKAFVNTIIRLAGGKALV